MKKSGGGRLSLLRWHRQAMKQKMMRGPNVAKRDTRLKQRLAPPDQFTEYFSSNQCWYLPRHLSVDITLLGIEIFIENTDTVREIFHTWVYQPRS